MSARDEILQRLRASRVPQAPPVKDHARFTEPAPGDIRAMARRCGQVLEGAGGSWEWVDSPAAARMAVATRMQAWEIDSALAWAAEALPVPGLREIMETFGLILQTSTTWKHSVQDSSLSGRKRLDALQPLHRAPLGITGADAAFASTGTILICAGPGRSPLPAMMVQRHLVLLPAAKVYTTPEAWLASWRAAGRIEQLRQTRETLLVTGPSRSADIELEPVYGAQGPRDIHVMFIGRGG